MGADRGLSVRVHRDVPVEMRDGVILRADVYLPAEEGRYPVLLGRTCYGKESWGRWIQPERTAAEGYAVVVNDMRGTFASDGELDPFFHEGEDGYDVVEWCAAQSWSNGRVGMYGSSAPGFAQLLAAAEQPPSLVAIAPMQTWSSFGRGCVYDPGGAFFLYTQLWVLQLENMDPRRRLRAADPGYAERLERVARAVWSPGEGYGHLPLADFPALPPEDAPYYHRWLEHPDHDSFWEPLDIEVRYERIRVPALHLVGWFDKFRHGTTRNYEGLRAGSGSERAREGQRLVVGPWTHGIPVGAQGSEEWFGAASFVDARALVLRWYDHWLRDGDSSLLSEPRVRVFVTGVNRWRDADEWPLPETDYTPLYLRGTGDGDGVLSHDPPGAEPPDVFRYDPADPPPTVPGRASRAEGPIDVQEIEARRDVLLYTSAPLTEPLEVVGPAHVRLWAATTGDDTDWVVTLVDVEPGGRARRVTDGMLRARYRGSQARPAPVPPNEPVEYEIELRPLGNVFGIGHRIRLDVASASFPQYDRNLNRGRPFDAELAGSAATQLVFHDASRPSQVLLPLISRQ